MPLLQSFVNRLGHVILLLKKLQVLPILCTIKPQVSSQVFTFSRVMWLLHLLMDLVSQECRLTQLQPHWPPCLTSILQTYLRVFALTDLSTLKLFHTYFHGCLPHLLQAFYLKVNYHRGLTSITLE